MNVLNLPPLSVCVFEFEVFLFIAAAAAVRDFGPFVFSLSLSLAVILNHSFFQSLPIVNHVLTSLCHRATPFSPFPLFVSFTTTPPSPFPLCVFASRLFPLSVASP